MIRKIKVEQLIPGMYVHNLHQNWMEHTFLLNRFPVRDERMIQKITDAGILELDIDTSKGLDVPAPVSTDGQTAPASSVPAHGIEDHPPRTTRQEIVQAKRVYNEAIQVVRGVLTDVRLGKQVEVERISPLVEGITESIFRNPDAIISLTRIKQKDNYTFQHSVSVCTLLIAFGRALNMDSGIIHQLGIGGLLHDIGKMRVPEEILKKPGRLTLEEYAVMKGHVSLGLEILNQSKDIPQLAFSVTGEHHERMDGSGYPAGAASEAISQYGQIAAIVDVYDALTSTRVYQQSVEPTAALRRLLELSDTFLHRVLVEHFIKVIGIYPIGSLVRLKSGLLAVVVERGRENLLQPLVRVVFDTNRKRPMEPRLLDLAVPNALGDIDTIIAYEPPDRWGINPHDHL